MTPTKDPSYFAYGLDARGQLLWGDPEFHRFPVKTRAEYERLFEDVGGATAVGEASTMYLECPQSAGRIKEIIPGARILCSLRHPVDRAYSDYLMYLRRRGNRFQPERDLRAAADLGPSRLPLDADRPSTTTSCRATTTPSRAIASACSCSTTSGTTGRVHPGRLPVSGDRSHVRPRFRHAACARAAFR